MNIAVIGTGYVGLVCGAGFAEMGNCVWCVDTDKKKIDGLKQGVIPIYEPGLKEIVLENMEAEHLFFTTDIHTALQESTICFIAVGTPMGEDGSADLSYVLGVASEIGQCMQHHMYVVDKSTVPVGTADKVSNVIQSELDKRKSSLTFSVISNPEFLKEGAAIEDFVKPDRIVLGVSCKEAEDVMRELYGPFTKNHDNLFVMDVRSAEMTKYAANAMLATKISFMNEIANICERVGANVNHVRTGIGSDSRIGYSFIYPGCGYGGSCFPKDVQALINTSIQHNYQPNLLQSVETVNAKQKYVLADKVLTRFGDKLDGLQFAIWGLSFKPGTDDMREAPAIYIINKLLEHGAIIRAYDPKANQIAENYYFNGKNNISFVASKYDAVKDSSALLLITEWKEFRSPDFDELHKLMKTPIIFDGRNQYDERKMVEHGFEYFQIGV